MRPIIYILVFVFLVWACLTNAQTPEEVKALLVSKTAADKAAKAAQIEAAKISLREKQEIDVIINCWQSWIPVGETTLTVYMEITPGNWIPVSVTTRNLMPCFVAGRLNVFEFIMPATLNSTNIKLEWSDITLTPVGMRFYSGWARECKERQ